MRSEHEQYEIDLMSHATAWPKKFRNHFCAEPGSLDDDVWRGLVAQGQAELVDKGSPLSGGDRTYRVTDEGIRRLESCPDQ